MGRPRKRPAEFPTDWHFEQHLKDLEREIEGRKDRLAWFKSMDKEVPDRELGIKTTEMELEAARAQLEHYTGHKGASTRPAKATSSRKAASSR